mgnify:CR=1 FL=1
MLLDKCTACDMNIRQNARYCHACGVPVWPLRICESCNLPTPASGSFCDQCGSTLENPGHVSRVVPVSSIEHVDHAVEPDLNNFDPDFDLDFDSGFDSDDEELDEAQDGKILIYTDSGNLIILSKQN